jgi:hypothetical protein
MCEIMCLRPGWGGPTQAMVDLIERDKNKVDWPEDLPTYYGPSSRPEDMEKYLHGQPGEGVGRGAV